MRKYEIIDLRSRYFLYVVLFLLRVEKNRSVIEM